MQFKDAMSVIVDARTYLEVHDVGPLKSAGYTASELNLLCKASEVAIERVRLEDQRRADRSASRLTKLKPLRGGRFDSNNLNG
jgi:hypothetical protein